jgi:hypothetical protein
VGVPLASTIGDSVTSGDATIVGEDSSVGTSVARISVSAGGFWRDAVLFILPLPTHAEISIHKTNNTAEDRILNYLPISIIIGALSWLTVLSSAARDRINLYQFAALPWSAAANG